MSPISFPRLSLTELMDSTEPQASLPVENIAGVEGRERDILDKVLEYYPLPPSPRKEGGFKCTHEGCDFDSNRSGNLTIHMRTHSGENPFINVLTKDVTLPLLLVVI